MGSPFALRHEQDFDLEGDVHALACFGSVSVSVWREVFHFHLADEGALQRRVRGLIPHIRIILVFTVFLSPLIGRPA